MCLTDAQDYADPACPGTSSLTPELILHFLHHIRQPDTIQYHPHLVNRKKPASFGTDLSYHRCQAGAHGFVAHAVHTADLLQRAWLYEDAVLQEACIVCRVHGWVGFM